MLPSAPSSLTVLWASLYMGPPLLLSYRLWEVSQGSVLGSLFSLHPLSGQSPLFTWLQLSPICWWFTNLPLQTWPGASHPIPCPPVTLWQLLMSCHQIKRNMAQTTLLAFHLLCHCWQHHYAPCHSGPQFGEWVLTSSSSHIQAICKFWWWWWWCFFNVSKISPLLPISIAKSSFISHLDC